MYVFIFLLFYFFLILAKTQTPKPPRRGRPHEASLSARGRRSPPLPSLHSRRRDPGLAARPPPLDPGRSGERGREAIAPLGVPQPALAVAAPRGPVAVQLRCRPVGRWRRWAPRCGRSAGSSASCGWRAARPAGPTGTRPPTGTSWRPSALTGSPARSCAGPSRSCISRPPPTCACCAACGTWPPCTTSTTAGGSARPRRWPAWWASACPSSREGRAEAAAVRLPSVPQ